MNTKILIGVMVTIGIVAAICFFSCMRKVDNDRAPVEHLIKVKLVDSTWKVIYMKDGKQTKVHAIPGDKIIWELEGTNAYFQFNDKALFGKFNAKALSGKSNAEGFSKQPLKLPVLPGAKSGKYFYSIFCTGEPAGYAEEDSPPVIIID